MVCKADIIADISHNAVVLRDMKPCTKYQLGLVLFEQATRKMGTHEWTEVAVEMKPVISSRREAMVYLPTSPLPAIAM